MNGKDHLASERRSSLSSAPGALCFRDRLHAHGANDNGVKCTILGTEEEVSARKALEALWIPNKNSQQFC